MLKEFRKRNSKRMEEDGMKKMKDESGYRGRRKRTRRSRHL
jgi:hypothetical protein